MLVTLDTFHGFKHATSESAVVIEGETFDRLRRIVLSMAFDIIDFCEEHDIDCMLVGGSCLGAVRHEGMIPWDDDMDLAMSRRDFDRFCKLFPESPLAQKYELTVPGETVGHVILLSQVRAKGTTFRGKDDFSENCGIPVDIFVIENTPDNPVLRNMQSFASMVLGFLQSARKFAKYPERYRSLAGDDSDLRKAVETKIRIGRLARMLPLEWWTNAAIDMYSRSKNDSSTNVTIPSGMRHFTGELQERAVFFPPATLRFEGRDVKVPHDPDAYLRCIYGEDYMTPPSEENREVHVALELDFGGLTEGDA